MVLPILEGEQPGASNGSLINYMAEAYHCCHQAIKLINTKDPHNEAGVFISLANDNFDRTHNLISSPPLAKALGINAFFLDFLSKAMQDNLQTMALEAGQKNKFLCRIGKK